MAALLEKGFSKLTVDAATALVVLIFLDECRARVLSFGSHRLYLNAVLGLGSGASIALLLVLTLAQLAACAVIALPALYNNLGTAVPSTALGATLLIEMILYHGFADSELFLKASMVEVSLALIGLLRGDRRVRAGALGTPIHGSAISAEAALRGACTSARAALVGPPLCVALALWSLVYHPFWLMTGAAYEINRTSFFTNAALSAVLLFAAGQDRSESKNVANRLFRFSRLGYKQCYRLFYGHVPDGHKKVL